MKCTCNNKDFFRIPLGNAFKLKIAVRAFCVDGTEIERFTLTTDDTLMLTSSSGKTEMTFEVEEGNNAVVTFDGTLPLGYYGFEFSGVFEGEAWRYAVDKAFQVVMFTNQSSIPVDGILIDDCYNIDAVIRLTSIGPNADWAEQDPASSSYIRNKPDLSIYATDAELTNEARQRANMDTVLSERITNEATTRQQADQTLHQNIGTEETRARAAEQANAGRIATIEGVIPTAASPQNQLADKAFVNSSITTNTAVFRGTYNSVAELQNVPATNNDYAFVIEHDAQGNEYYDRYKYNGTTWVFEYKIESTPFTAAQWAAIQSGITSGEVEKLEAMPEWVEINAMIQNKQDLLVSGQNIKTVMGESILGSGNVNMGNFIAYPSFAINQSGHLIMTDGVPGLFTIEDGHLMYNFN